MEKCAKCGTEMIRMLFRPISDKWLYVFEGKPGKDVGLVEEIFVENKDHWRILGPPGRAGTRSQRSFEGSGTRKGSHLHSVQKDVHYQFFLSPIQLSKGALSVLGSLAKLKRNLSARDEQLGGTLVEREFHGPPNINYSWGEERSYKEIVPVIDPFSWSEEVNEWDYRPVLEAQYELLLNRNVRAKLEMASVLKSLIGAGSDDEFDLIDEINRDAEKLDSSNNADVWFKQYNGYNTLLAGEVDKACQRLIAWLDSDAHRVIEMSCQEELDAPGFRFPLRSPLGLGIVHYTSVLRDILGCPAGEAFVTRLSSDTIKAGGIIPGNAFYKMEQRRIPYKNVLFPGHAEERALRKVRAELQDVTLNLLTIFGPTIVRRAPKYAEAEAFVEHLLKLGLHAEVTGDVDTRKPLGYKEFRLLTNTALKINEHMIGKLGKTLLPRRMWDKYASRIKLFQDWEDGLYSVYSLWTGAKIYGDDPKPYEGHVARITRVEAKVQYPFKVAGFAVSQSKLGLAWRAKKNYGIDIDTWTSNKTVFVSSESIERIAEADLDRFARNLRFYKGLATAGRILSGPAALVFGGWDLVIQTESTLKEWEDGNYAAATGAALLATAAVITVAGGVIGTLALFDVAGTAALAEVWLGPLGIIAAIVTLLGILVIWAWSKNEVEKFAAHCFLGNDYGKGSDEGPAWAESESFRSWDDGADRFIRQDRYLINLISAFKVLVHPYNRLAEPREGVLWGGAIQPGYLPPGTIAEVIVIGHYVDENGNNIDLTSMVIVDMDTGDYIVVGDEVKMPWVNATPSGSWGAEKFIYFQVALPHKLRKGMRVRPTSSRVPNPIGNWTLKVRFVLAGGVHFLPPGKDKYVTVPFGYESLKSSLNA